MGKKTTLVGNVRTPRPPQIEELEGRLLLAGLPSPWSAVDVGAPTVQGSSSYAAATPTFTNVGAGTGIGGTSDQFHYAYQQLTTDGVITARVSLPGTAGSHAQAGLMIRDGLGPNATFADLTLTPGGAQFQHRDKAGAAASTLSLSTNSLWLELARNGNTVSAYLSPTGANGTWTLAGTAGILLGSTVDVGMVVTSGSASDPVSSSFDGVHVEQTVPLGGNAGFANAFVDLTRDVRQMNSLSWGAAPTLDKGGNPTGDFRISLYDVLHPGTYKVSFTGASGTTLSVMARGSTGQSATATFTNRVYDAATGTTTVDLNLSASADGSDVTFSSIGFANTGGALKNLHVIRPGYSVVNPPLFTDEFLAHYRSLGPTTLRFMDATSTNGNLVAEWSERTLPTYAFPGLAAITRTVNTEVNLQVQQTTQTTLAGLPWEYSIALANAVHADLWVNIPVLASDNYVQQLATLIKIGDKVGGVAYAGLSPDLNVYVEYGNEMWNYGFQQWHVNLATTLQEVSGGHSILNKDGVTNPWTLAQRKVAQRTVQISRDFASILGAAATNTRVRTVLAGQEGSTANEDQLRFVQSNYGNPGNYFYGLAQGTYFGLTAAQDADPNLTPTQIITDLLSNVSSSIPVIQSFVTEAHAWGLRPLTYEGGPALGSILGGVASNHLAANAAAEKDPRFATVVQEELKAWLASGGGLFNYYSLGQAQFGLGSKYGDWWITDNINDKNQPKEVGYRAVRYGAMPTLTGGFSTLPGELDGRNYSRNSTPLDNQGYASSYMNPSPVRDYSIRLDAPGTYQLRVNVPLTSASQKIAISVNGQPVGTVLTPIGSGDGSTPVVVIHLEAGFNTIRLSTTSSINSLQFLDAQGTPLGNTLPILNLATFGIRLGENKPFTQSFTVSDAETTAAGLTVTAVSDNPTLVPNDAAHLVIKSGTFAGGKNRQLVITPASGQTGLATVTITLRTPDGQSRVTVLHVVVSPTPPANLIATATSPSQVSLKWTAGNPSTAYQVDQSTDAHFTTNLVTYNLPAGATAFTAMGLKAGTTYYFRVRTVGLTAAGNSANSAPTLATTAAAPGGTATPAVSSAASTWTATPTVSSAASAVLASNGRSAVLTVLGAVAGGESGLTYTWIPIGPLPAPVSFSANGTNAAKNTNAVFSRAGTYTFLVVITDPHGLATTSVVTMKVGQVATGFQVAQSATTVARGATFQLTPSAFVDQFGKPMAIPPQVVWSASRGAITPWGQYLATGSRVGPVTITAVVGGVKRTVTLMVS